MKTKKPFITERVPALPLVSSWRRFIRLLAPHISALPLVPSSIRKFRVAFAEHNKAMEDIRKSSPGADIAAKSMKKMAASINNFQDRLNHFAQYDDNYGE